MIVGFAPLGYNVLKITLPKREHILRFVATKGPWSEKGTGIVFHGWTDSQRKPLTNFMTDLEGRPIFSKEDDGTKKYK